MMNWQFTPYAVPLFVGAVLLAAIMVIAWRRRATRGAVLVLLICLGVSVHGLGYAFELGSTTTGDILFWLKVEYLGVVSVPALVFMLSLAFNDQGRFLTPLTCAILLAVPAMTLVLAWTNEQHELIWRDLRLEPFNDLYLAEFSPGTWYWVNVGYIWLMSLAAIAVFGWAFGRARGVFRRQLGVMLLATLFPLLAYLLYLVELFDENLDLTPYGLLATTVVLAWGMFNYGLMDIMPVARAALLDSMTDAVIVVDGQDRVVDLNPEAVRLFGSGREALAGRPAREVLAGWYHEVEALRHEDQAHTEIEVTLGGQARHFDLRLSSLAGRDGLREGRLLVLRDITDRTRAEAALKETNQRLTTLRRVDAELNRKLEVRYVTRMALDAALRISAADAAFIGLAQGDEVRILHALGVWPQQVVDTTIPANVGITARVLRTRQVERVLDVMADPDYVAVMPGMRAQITVPLLSGERLIGVITLVTSTPERFTEGVLESVRLLAARVAVAIDNAFMYEERERLVSELDAYAHTVAHDLKNPLATVCGYASLLLEDYDELSEEHKREYLGYLLKGGQKSIDIINALLLLAGVRSQDAIETKRLDMAAIVGEARLRLAQLIDERQATLVLPETWPDALGYAPWIEEIWANYISNAIKYGGDPPRVELGWDRPAPDSVRCWVRDNGQGLSQEQQARLFRPFTRLAQADVKSGGHGLGLSIVQRIAGRLGGTVGVESAVGKGSLFYFTLPAAPRPDSAGEPLEQLRWDDPAPP